MSPTPIPTPDQIRYWMELYAVTPRMLAEALGYTPNHMRRILRGVRRLMPDMVPQLLTYFQERRAALHHDRAVMAELDAAA